MEAQRGQVGLVGEYAVLSALILHGFNAARMDGNSKDIDILCTNSDFSNATKVQVKTEGAQAFYRARKTALPHYAFLVSMLDRYENYYRQALLAQKIHFVFYLCPQTQATLAVKPFDADRKYGRFFVASPEEVVAQIDAQLKYGRPSHLYFRVFTDDDPARIKYRGGLIKDFENRWDKLAASWGNVE